jgi:excinuclease ABC subunit A
MIFSQTREAKAQGFGPGYFSFNTSGGRCEECKGAGHQIVEMQFLSDVVLICETCKGKRFKKEILEIRYREKNIDDVLGISISDALVFFSEREKRILYIFDEPTIGLHPDDVTALLSAFQRLVEEGHTVIVIEHNLDLIKCADYIIDLGPEGGDKGGKIVVQGTPEEVIKSQKSYTAKFLKPHLQI